jgi:hypothetical protein
MGRGGCVAGVTGAPGRAGHAPALVGAAPAGERAVLTVLHWVFAALSGAGVAHVGAQLANRAGEWATARAIPGGGDANLGAVHIQRDACTHHFDVGLLQTRRGAIFAGAGTLIARFNTGFELLVHVVLLLVFDRHAIIGRLCERRRQLGPHIGKFDPYQGFDGGRATTVVRLAPPCERSPSSRLDHMQAREHEGKARVSGVAAISMSADVASGTLYTCLMHPEIRSDRPGNCPKCGMTLEPLLPELDRDDNAELKDFSRRFWWTCR